MLLLHGVAVQVFSCAVGQVSRYPGFPAPRRM
jgi:hypothetical protein